jgi:TolB-like protein
MTAALLTLALALGASDDKPSLAVLYFDNNTNSAELDIMRKGLADMMVTDLVAWDGVSIVEREKLEAVISELKLQRTKYFDKTAAVKIGQFLQARYLLTGTMTFSGTKLVLDARLIDAKKDTAVVSARAEGAKDDIFPIEQSLVEQIAAGIDVRLKNEPARKRAKVPSLEALLAYSKAIDLSDQGKVEEAEKAFAALVSKSPTFLMARERKEAVVKALEDYKKRQREIVTASAIRVAKAADDALKKENDFEKLPSAEQAYLLQMRRVKGHFLARVLKQYLSTRESSLKVVLKTKKQQAIDGMRAWHANQLRYLDELKLYGRSSLTNWGREGLITPKLANDLTDSGLGPYDIEDQQAAFEALASFVLKGRVVMGTGANGNQSDYTIAPALGDLAPEEAKRVWQAYDDRIAQALKTAAAAPAAQREQTAREAIVALDRKAERLLSLDRDDDAVAALQVVLDTFPTDSRNGWREEQIKKVIGGSYDHHRDQRERWLKGLKGCDDMDLRVGAGFAVDDKQRHLGIDGIDALWAEVIKACPPSAKTRRVLDYIAKDLAMDAARYDDCELAKKYWRLYVEQGGSISDMLGYHKNYVPWCDYGDITKGVQWIKFRMDRNWTPEVDQGLMAVKSYDGKQLAISGRNERGSIDLGVYLVPDGKTWKCRNATWRTRDGDQVDGTCTANLTKEAKEQGDYDEGSFSASFSFTQDGLKLKTELSEGSFKVRRQ